MNTYKQIEAEILAASNILITAHKSADGDSVGSSLGLLNFIEKLGKKAIICHPDKAPEFLDFLDLSPIITMEHVYFCAENSMISCPASAEPGWRLFEYFVQEIFN